MARIGSLKNIVGKIYKVSIEKAIQFFDVSFFLPFFFNDKSTKGEKEADNSKTQLHFFSFMKSIMQS